MFPLQDLNPRRRTPILTYMLIGINVIVFLWELSLSESGLQSAFLELSIVPAKVTENPFSVETLLDFLRSMFFHGGIEHIAGNMLYLWIFGDNVEDRLGAVLYLILYFVSGFVAGFSQVIIDPNSQIPLVGASGAIAGVLGAYAIIFPGVKVRGIVGLGRFGAIQEWPALIVLGLWFVLQLVSIAPVAAEVQGGGGVAFFAHIGGFIAGAVMGWLFVKMVPQPPPKERREMLYERAERYKIP